MIMLLAWDMVRPLQASGDGFWQFFKGLNYMTQRLHSRVRTQEKCKQMFTQTLVHSRVTRNNQKGVTTQMPISW